ncbi:helix-turn-helix domain-containing protein [Sporomusa sphaeroides DSM 2875]|uniref:helix-turn-helix domain-containing protein n=1 Tax=Sporomusa sphaeroides TaxID=47679 RepID=UPI00202F751C|nr:helix-turn-helix transcriptional regulator [Sporomusa sphaeroides]MCM0758058.1 helix-turn-helix domain-containing protein [Sporomusa sphaeroides DSM 2875]
MKEFPNNLRKIRTTQSNRDLRSGNRIAELMNISPQYYYDLETGRGGRKLNAEHLAKLTKIFDVSADEILGGQPLVDSLTEQKKPKDLVKFLEQTEVMFDGETYELNEEDREKLKSAFEFVFWHAKQKNKRKKS